MNSYEPTAYWQETMMLLSILQNYRVSFKEHINDEQDILLYFKVKKRSFDRYIFVLDIKKSKAGTGNAIDEIFSLCQYIEDSVVCVPHWIEKNFKYVRCIESNRTPAG
ncbi:hypothetical protein [Jeotgalibacillus alimentarius]|uniref:hypothetical protein n=1 Tax=Jeotgalibacillus alimentarius TaxID=135826 RepID=UPI0005978425|nr:hypothetical protein [Jeotgalibacillus alimentarius]